MKLLPGGGEGQRFGFVLFTGRNAAARLPRWIMAQRGVVTPISRAVRPKAAMLAIARNSRNPKSVRLNCIGACYPLLSAVFIRFIAARGLIAIAQRTTFPT